MTHKVFRLMTVQCLPSKSKLTNNYNWKCVDIPLYIATLNPLLSSTEGPYHFQLLRTSDSVQTSRIVLNSYYYKIFDSLKAVIKATVPVERFWYATLSFFC